MHKTSKFVINFIKVLLVPLIYSLIDALILSGSFVDNIRASVPVVLILFLFVLFLAVLLTLKEISEDGKDEQKAAIDKIVRSIPQNEELKRELEYQRAINETLREVTIDNDSLLEIEVLMDLLSGDSKIIKETIERIDDRLKEKYLSLLTERLYDIQSTKRIAAVQAISKFETPQAREVLVKLIKDKDHDVRYNATLGLFELSDPSTVEPLIENLNDESIKGITIETLGIIGNSKATEPLIKELESCTKDYSKPGIIIALGRIGDSRAIKPLVNILTKTTDKNTIMNILLSLGRIPEEASLQVLQNYLIDEDQDIAKRAIESLCSILYRVKNREIIQKLRPLLSHENVDIVEYTVKALGTLGYPETIPLLIEALHHNNDRIRQTAASQLKPIYGAAVINPLLECLNDENTNVRCAAIRSLGYFQHPKVIDRIKLLLEDDNESIKREVIGAVGRLGYAGANKKLVGLLKEEKYRRIAEEALQKNGDPSIFEPLKLLMENDDPQLQSSIISILGYIGNEEIVGLIIGYLDKESPDIVKSAIEALGSLGSEKSIPALSKFLNSATRDFRIYAIYALGEIGSDKAVEDLLKLIDDEDLEISSFVVYSLGKIGSNVALESLIKRVNNQPDHLKVIYNNAIGCILLNGDEDAKKKAGIFFDNALTIHTRFQRKQGIFSFMTAKYGNILGLIIPPKLLADYARFYELQNDAQRVREMYSKINYDVLAIGAVYKLKLGKYLYSQGFVSEAEKLFTEAWPHLFRKNREKIAAVSSIGFRY